MPLGVFDVSSDATEIKCDVAPSLSTPKVALVFCEIGSPFFRPSADAPSFSPNSHLQSIENNP